VDRRTRSISLCRVFSLLRGQEAGGRKQEAGGRRQEAGGRRQEAGGRKQEAGGRRQEAGSRRQEAGGRRQEAGGRRQEAGSRRKQPFFYYLSQSPRLPVFSAPLLLRSSAPLLPYALTFRTKPIASLFFGFV
jgi:hypothetical protein